MNELIESFKETLFETSIEGIAQNAELIIDNIAESEIAKNIPIADLLLGMWKSTRNLYLINLLKQTNKFIQEFNSKKIENEKLEKYKKKISNNKKKLNEELGRVLIILNETIDDKKSELLAKFYLAYIYEEISWERFCEFSDVINRIFVSDIETIFEIYKDTREDEVSLIIYEKYRTDRLIATGLLSVNSAAFTVGEISGKMNRNSFQKNGFGELFVKIAKR